MSERVLVVAAHPDDEALGCGATMARHVSFGDEVHVVIMADGVKSRHGDGDEQVSAKLEVARNANGILGTHSIEFFMYPDNAMDTVSQLDVAKAIEGKVDEFKPTIVYTHWPHDLNIDHRVTSRAVSVACRPVPGCSVKSLLYFEVLSSTEWQTNGKVFSPNYFVDVSATMAKKIIALQAYEGEMRDHPHARSFNAVNNLAAIRGASVGVVAAEAFMLARRIV